MIRFKKRHFLVTRRVTKIGQSLPDNAEVILNNFLIRVENTIREHIIPPSRILKFDETPVIYNTVSNYSIDKKGRKWIPCKTGGQEKMRVSLCVACSSSGFKLPIFLIYKGVDDGRVYKEITNFSLVKSKRVYVDTQENAWMNETTMISWIKKVYTRSTTRRSQRKNYCY